VVVVIIIMLTEKRAVTMVIAVDLKWRQRNVAADQKWAQQPQQ
jgi:hypothetical protein